MGYFSNGTEGMAYEADWCVRCVHHGDCAVWDVHLLHNYDEGQNEASILHDLIPRSPDGLSNLQCRLFWEKACAE